MDPMIFKVIVWGLAWLASIYFYRRSRITEENKDFLAAILSVTLMGVVSWAMEFEIGSFLAGFIVLVTIALWILTKRPEG